MKQTKKFGKKVTKKTFTPLLIKNLLKLFVISKIFAIFATK